MGFKVLATSKEQAEDFERTMRLSGEEPDGAVVYEGPIPPNSYMWISPFVRMSTPEFFLFRKIAESNDELAMLYISEMFGTVATRLTVHEMPSGRYERIPERRLGVLEMFAYLEEAPHGCEKVVERAFDLIGMVFSNGMIEGYEQFIERNYRLN